MFGLPPRVEIPQPLWVDLSSLASKLGQSASHPVAQIVSEDTEQYVLWYQPLRNIISSNQMDFGLLITAL